MRKPFKTKKALGQHFLRDETVIERIILAVQPKNDQKFIEIGPGQGALTQSLLPHVQSLEAIEYDQEVIPFLKRYCAHLGQLNIHISDILKFDFETLFQARQSTYRVVGNLPYNISTPIFFYLLQQTHAIKDMHFMVQKEVADRVVAEPGSKTYGRLSVMMQYFCQTELLFDVPPQAFLPPPKVNSAVIRLLPYEQQPVKATNKPLFINLVRDCFNLRRKTLRNSVKSYINTSSEIDCPVDLSLRPENLSVTEFVRLANFIDETNKITP